MINYPYVIETWNTQTGEKGKRTFETKEEFLPYVEGMFKIPGEYNLKNTKATWQHAASMHLKKGYYTSYAKDSLGHKDYWIKQERPRMINGVEIDGFYLPGFFYQYMNYSMMQHKRSKKFTFPDVRDTDYHTFLYFLLCMIKGKHAVICKTRQRGFSLKICFLLYWSYMWFDKSINTMGASDLKFVKKSWIFLEWFHQFTFDHTPFRRGPNPAKKLEWEEFLLNSEGQKRGKQSILKGVTFQTSATNDVGGQQDIFFYEEAGITKTMIETLGYIRNAIEDGDVTTGLIIVSGSVGELDDCEDLKTLMKNPDAENFLAVENVYNDDKFPKEMGLFIPDEWSLGGYIDEDGNSLVEEAVAFIARRDAIAKKNKSAEAYRLYLSQNPSKPSTAFDLRKDSKFPTAKIETQQERIKSDPSRHPRKIQLDEAEGKITWKASDKEEVIYPVDKKQEDKSGVVLMWEPPDDTIIDRQFSYFAGVDSIASNITETSESLFSTYIIKGAVETRFWEDDRWKTRLEAPRLVASYTGRIQIVGDGLTQTNKIGELLIRLYKAHAYCERNHNNFIGHMQRKGYTWPKLLKERDVPLTKEIDLKETFSEFGVYMDNTGKKLDYIIDKIIEQLNKEVDIIYKHDEKGFMTEETGRMVYGVETINDYWLLEEFKLWYPGRNADRLNGYGLALSAANAYYQNKIYQKKTDASSFKKEEVVKQNRTYDLMGNIPKSPNKKQRIIQL